MEGLISRIIDLVELQGRDRWESGALRDHVRIDHIEEMRNRLLAAGLPVVVQIRLPIASTVIPPAGAAVYGKAILSALRITLANHPCGYVDDGFEIQSAKLTIPLNPILRGGAADRIGCIAAVTECLQAMDFLRVATIGYRWHTDWHVVHPTESVGQWCPFSYRDGGKLVDEDDSELVDVC
jgi:hypothetical protein